MVRRRGYAYAYANSRTLASALQQYEGHLLLLNDLSALDRGRPICFQKSAPSEPPTLSGIVSGSVQDCQSYSRKTDVGSSQ